MNESKQVYKPKFPKAHALLLEIYERTMTSKPEEVSVWAERFKALIKGWEALNEDGVLPRLFTQEFWMDARDIAQQVNAKIDRDNLCEQQKLMSFAMSNLQNRYSG